MVMFANAMSVATMVGKYPVYAMAAGRKNRQDLRTVSHSRAKEERRMSKKGHGTRKVVGLVCLPMVGWRMVT